MSGVTKKFTERKRRSHTKCVLHLWLALRVPPGGSLSSWPQKIFTCTPVPSATTPSHSTSIIPIPSPSFVTAIKRLSQPDCSVWRRVRSPFLSSWLLSLKTKKYTYIQKIYICVQTVALQFTEPRWTVRDPNKLLIINWGKYAVIVALAPHLLSFFYGWVAEN